MNRSNQTRSGTKFIPGFIFLFTSFLCSGQSITNVSARQADKKIIVTYDITGGAQGSLFTVSLFVSEDGGYNWKGPATAVTGDAGTRVTGGTNKLLTWDVLSEPGRQQLKGDQIAFKIQAKINAAGSGATTTSAGTPCPGMSTITDPRDGQVYPTVKIGQQCWMQRNMNFNMPTSWCYENKTENCDTYGRLFDWETAKAACPAGWHLPSEEEWSTLDEYLGGIAIAGGKMKETGTAHWKSSNTSATNSSSFTALPGGSRSRNGSVYGLTNNAYFWSSSQSGPYTAWNRSLYYSSEGINKGSNGKTYGYSCRCLQD